MNQQIATSTGEAASGGLVRQPSDEPFRTRVAVGTLVGVMTCLLFAGLLMLVFRLSNSRGIAEAGNGDGSGTGTGDKAGDGSSSADDANGDNDQTVAGDVNDSTAVTVGSDGQRSGIEAQTEAPGNANRETAQEDESATKGTGIVETEKAPPRRSYIVPPLEQLQPDSSTEDGIQAPGAARAPGMFAGRGAETRKKLAESEGGSAASEAAVELGLKWLAEHQEKDGHWSLHQFHATGECNGRCTMPGGVSSDAAGTGFGLLPFLGAGYTHKSGKYKDAVQRGLDWLITDQTKEGTFRHCENGTLYAHGIASIALCEAWAMTKDLNLKQPAQRAIDYIVQAQHAAGGWRYQPGQPGDTSVSGWQVIALRSAQQGGLRVPKNVMTKVSGYLDSVQVDKQGSGYCYMPGDRITDAMVAEGLLCRIYTTWNSKRPGLEAGVRYLLAHPPQIGGGLYYWYYATQVMHHRGGEPWQEWNREMRDLLIDSQSTDGHEAGSWPPQGGHDSAGGRVYATSLALLTLEVYYRHKREL